MVLDKDSDVAVEVVNLLLLIHQSGFLFLVFLPSVLSHTTQRHFISVDQNV